jgi:Domain of unknown function (DUF4160)
MPTILRLSGLRVVIYPNDHLPKHVHVVGPSGEAVFELNCPAGPVTLRESYGFTTRLVRSIAEQLATSLVSLCKAWEYIHEPD